VLLAVLQARDTHHERAVEALRAHPPSTRYFASASVYAETLARAHASGKVDETERFLLELNVDVAPIDKETARRAAALRAAGSPRLTLGDALALAPAIVHDPPLPFLTFDDAQQRRYEQEVAAG
jgi:uncharacterized protein with PIN domain